MQKQNQDDDGKKYKEKIISMMRRAYPNATDQQLEQGFENPTAYVDTAWGIAERIEKEERTKSSTPRFLSRT